CAPWYTRSICASDVPGGAWLLNAASDPPPAAAFDPAFATICAAVACGNPCATSCPVRARRNADVTMAPSRATPNTPPSSRLVLVAAEATPACLVGTEAITAAVMGAMVRAMPEPHTTMDGKMTPKYEDAGSERSMRARPIAERAGPAVMNHREPYRSESRPATGASSRIITGNGNR